MPCAFQQLDQRHGEFGSFDYLVLFNVPITQYPREAEDASFITMLSQTFSLSAHSRKINLRMSPLSSAPWCLLALVPRNVKSGVLKAMK